MRYYHIESISPQAERAENMAYQALLLHVEHLRVEHEWSIRKIAKRVGYKEPEVKRMLAEVEARRG